jgi:hypothetical protein
MEIARKKESFARTINTMFLGFEPTIFETIFVASRALQWITMVNHGYPFVFFDHGGTNVLVKVLKKNSFEN